MLSGARVDWRAALVGLYLTVHLAALLPWATELFSNEGLLPEGSLSPLLYAFPNILALHDGPVVATLLVALGAVAALALALGTHVPKLAQHRRLAALMCLYVLACLFGRNPLIRNPGLPYVGLCLLAIASAREGRIPRPVMRALWFLLAAGYAYSGLTKLVAPSWLDGTALEHLVRNPLAYEHARGLLALPAPLRAVATYGVLVLEVAFPLFVLSPRIRPWAWLAMTLLHVSLLVLIDFADLTFGMLAIHALLYDPSWFRQAAQGRTGTLRRTPTSAPTPPW